MRKIDEKHLVIYDIVRVHNNGIMYSTIVQYVGMEKKLHLFSATKNIQRALDKLIRWGLIRKEEYSYEQGGINKYYKFFALTPEEIVKQKIK
jgi:predicted transcriptional regulator